MPYSAEISRTNPSCFLFVIDQSASMEDPFGSDGQKKAKADGVVVMTAIAKSRLAKLYPVDVLKVRVIPHGAHVERLHPSEACASPSGEANLLTWGLLGPGKGIEHAIDAVGLLQDLRQKIDPAPDFGGKTGHIGHDEVPLGAFVEFDRPVEAIDQIDVPVTHSPHEPRKTLAVFVERRRDEMLNGDGGGQALPRLHPLASVSSGQRRRTQLGTA